MNRRDRRRSAKLSRDAKPEEILRGEHGPVQDDAGKLMKAMLEVCQKAFPNYGITLFVNEREVLDGADRLPRFNYASTENRADMIAVLKSFIQRHETGVDDKVDRINDAPPTATKQ